MVDFTKFTCRQLVTCGDISSIAKLDHIADGAGLLSPLVDDLVSELPAPINTSHISKLVNYSSVHINLCPKLSLYRVWLWVSIFYNSLMLWTPPNFPTIATAVIVTVASQWSHQNFSET